MALDPTISLQAGKNIPQYDPFGAAQKGLDLVSLMQKVEFQPRTIEQQLASQKASELATIESTRVSEQKRLEEERKINASKRLAEIGKQYSTVDPATGKIKIDKQKWLHNALSEGIPFEEVFKLAGDVSTEQEKSLTDETSRQDFVRNRLFESDHLLRQQKSPEEAAQMLDGIRDRLAKVIGPEAAAREVADRYGTNPLQIINRANINAQTEITPYKQETLKISNEQLKQAWEQITQAGYANVTGAEARNPKSAASLAMQNSLIAAGYPEADARKLNAAEIQNLVATKGVVTADIMTDRPRLLEQANLRRTEADFYDSLKSVADAVAKTSFAKEITLKNIIENKLSQYALQDEKVQALVAKVKEAQAKGLPVSEFTDPKILSQIAAKEAGLRRTQAETVESSAKVPTVSAATGRANPAGGPVIRGGKIENAAPAPVEAKRYENAVDRSEADIRQIERELRTLTKGTEQYRIVEGELAAEKARLADEKKKATSTSETKMVTIVRKSDGATAKVPEADAARYIASGRFERK